MVFLGDQLPHAYKFCNLSFMLCAYNKLKIVESIVTIMTNYNIRVAKLAFTIVQIQKQPSNSAHENTIELKSHPNVKVYKLQAIVL